MYPPGTPQYNASADASCSQNSDATGSKSCQQAQRPQQAQQAKHAQHQLGVSETSSATPSHQLNPVPRAGDHAEPQQTGWVPAADHMLQLQQQQRSTVQKESVLSGGEPDAGGQYPPYPQPEGPHYGRPPVEDPKGGQLGAQGGGYSDWGHPGGLPVAHWLSQADSAERPESELDRVARGSEPETVQQVMTLAATSL